MERSSRAALVCVFVLTGAACGSEPTAVDAAPPTSGPTADDAGAPPPAQDGAAPDSASDAGDAGACATPSIEKLTGTCATCAASTCCAEARAYDTNPDTKALDACYKACGVDVACVNGCVATHESAMTAGRLLDGCVRKSCESVCYEAAPVVTFIHAAPELGALDLCWRTSGTSAFQSAPASVPIAFKQLSRALVGLLPVGTVDLRVVLAGRACGDPGVASVDAVPLASGARATAVIFGGAGQPYAVKVLADEEPPVDGAAVRIMNAAAGAGTLTVSLTGATPTLLGGATYGQTWSGSGISGGGYRAFAVTPPQTSAEPSLRFAVAGSFIETVVHAPKGIGTSVFVTTVADRLALITCSDGTSCY